MSAPDFTSIQKLSKVDGVTFLIAAVFAVCVTLAAVVAAVVVGAAVNEFVLNVLRGHA